MTADELRERIDAIHVAELRMNTLNYLGRAWIAQFSADACIVADELLDRLDQQDEDS